MQPLYTEIEFKSSGYRRLLPLKCLHCERSFLRQKQRIQQVLSKHGHETMDFCSKQCQGLHSQRPTIKIECSHCKKPFFRNRKQTGIPFCSRTCRSTYFGLLTKKNYVVSVICKQCHKSFPKTSKEIRESPNHFCSHSCHAKWQNAHKTTGTRVSKLEKWLQEQPQILYSTLEFHFTRTDTINAELDIYIPSLKLAFELNGIFHYEPIYGPEKLTKMQTNDHRKMLACAEHGIELCIIDISHQKYFKQQSSTKFLDIIKQLINSRLLSAYNERTSITITKSPF